MICENCNQNEVPPHRKKYCDFCANLKAKEWDAKKPQSNWDGKSTQHEIRPVGNLEQPVPPPVLQGNVTDNDKGYIKKETGEFQSTVWNHQIAPNSYEVGKAGSRFKLYFETIDELKVKIAELKTAGLLITETEESLI